MMSDDTQIVSRIYYSERNLIEAAEAGKQITAAEIRVLTDRLGRLRHDFAAAITQRDEARALVGRAVPLVAFAVDVPQRALEAQQWLEDADQSSERPTNTPVSAATEQGRARP